MSYVVSLAPGRDPLCYTPASSCALRLSGKVKKVYLCAVNSAGRSNSIEVPLLPITGVGVGVYVCIPECV